MTVKQIVPDTIFPNIQDDYPIAGPFGVTGGRMMVSAPHVDGVIIIGAGDLMCDNTNAVLTRNAKGDWSLNRTAAGAETYNFRGLLNQGSLIRTGETYVRGDFNDNVAAPAKGISVLDFFAIYEFGVVNATTATLRLGKTIYSAVAGGAAPTQTDLVAATAISKVTTANYQEADVAGPSPQVFHTDDLSLIEIEANIVLANTGTMQFAGLGAHVYFNYD